MTSDIGILAAVLTTGDETATSLRYQICLICWHLVYDVAVAAVRLLSK